MKEIIKEKQYYEVENYANLYGQRKKGEILERKPTLKKKRTR
jgi:hypothetical protein